MITNQLTNINHQIYDEELAFTLLGSLWLSIHTFVVSFSIRTNKLPMELICGQLLQEKLLCKWEVQFNHGTKHETLIVKMCFWEVQKGVNWRKFKNEK
jgi:hypothetical protein